MICGDAALSKLDELLGDRYVRALKKGDDPKAVEAEQRAWLSDSRNACADAACLTTAYEARIADLTKIGWMTDEKARAICEEVVGALNDGTLNNRNRNAHHPVNAMLNYAYGTLENNVRMHLAGIGFDLSIGVLHTNYERQQPAQITSRAKQWPISVF